MVEDRLDEESRARLLQFTTGGCNVPAQGFKVRKREREQRRKGLRSGRDRQALDAITGINAYATHARTHT